MQETWRPVLGFEEWYEVSNLGRARSMRKPKRGGFRSREPYPLILTPLWYRKGYYKIQLGACWRTHKPKRVFLHRAIWEAFHGPIPDGLTVNHLDADPANNRLDNLELADFVRQAHHAMALGLVWHHTKNGPRKPTMTPERVRELRRLRTEGWTYQALADRYGIAASNVRWITTRRTWKHVA